MRDDRSETGGSKADPHPPGCCGRSPCGRATWAWRPWRFRPAARRAAGTTDVGRCAALPPLTSAGVSIGMQRGRQQTTDRSAGFSANRSPTSSPRRRRFAPNHLQSMQQMWTTLTHKWPESPPVHAANVDYPHAQVARITSSPCSKCGLPSRASGPNHLQSMQQMWTTLAREWP